eukprot:1158801-Pelagomonas_calceolata.AAC.1
MDCIISPCKSLPESLFALISISNSNVTPHTITPVPVLKLKSPSTPLCKVWAGSSTSPHILEPLKSLGLDTHTTNKLALKLHTNSVQHHQRRALENTPFTAEIRQGVLLVTLLIPIDLFLFPLGGGDTQCLGPRLYEIDGLAQYAHSGRH